MSDYKSKHLQLIPKLKVDPSVIQKKEGEKGKWLISRKYVLENFDHSGYIIGQSDGQCSELSNKQPELSIEKSIGQSSELSNEQSKKQVIELLEKQIEDLQGQSEKQTTELKEQLKQKDAQLEKQTTELKEQLKYQAEDFKELLSQKDQQIHQLHVLLKESKTSTIDYKPDENLGVFSKVLVKFGL